MQALTPAKLGWHGLKVEHLQDSHSVASPFTIPATLSVVQTAAALH